MKKKELNLKMTDLGKDVAVWDPYRATFVVAILHLLDLQAGIAKIGIDERHNSGNTTTIKHHLVSIPMQFISHIVEY